MKKAWPWIIVGILAIIALIVIFSKKKNRQKSVEPTSQPSVEGFVAPVATQACPPGYIKKVDGRTGEVTCYIASGEFVGTTLEESECACEHDPQIQEKIASYNQMPDFGFPWSSLKPQLKAQLLEECSCIKL